MENLSERRQISGWLLLDKPAGISSAQAVNKAKWILRAKKAGHAGTLDPEATGLLAIAFGEATKTIPYLMDARKTYDFRVVLGAETNTDDREGEITRTSELRPDDAEISAALGQFTGDIMQVPPAFSAVKIDGKRAYKAARAGEEVTIAARPLHVHALEFLARPDRDHLDLRLTCGKGGYVRSIARDLGQALGCLGHVHHLRRIASGPFDLADCVSFEELLLWQGDMAAASNLKPLEASLAGLREILLNEREAKGLRNGMRLRLSAAEGDNDHCWTSFEGEPVALGSIVAGVFHPLRVFAGNPK